MTDSAQLWFDFPDLVVPELPREATIQERFEAFAASNPVVESELTRMALELVEQGYKRISIKLLLEVLRWQALRTRPDASGYRINNSFSSRYARRLSDTVPALAGRFALRELKS